MKAKTWIGAALILVALFIGYDGFFIIDETQQVVVTQFGRVVGAPKAKPGLYFKVPVIQRANFFPKNLQEWDDDPGEIPTYDKTLIWVDTFARWNIVDARLFIESLKDMETGVARLGESINSKVRDAIASHKLIDIVRTSNRELLSSDTSVGDMTQDDSSLGTVKVGRFKIMEDVRQKAGAELAPYGIRLVDVKIKRLNYVDSVRKAVYGRMIAERKQMAEKYRSQGQGEASKIQGEMERDLKKITSLAYKKAQEIKGEADARATAIYAGAYGMDPDFYSFLKTLDVYKETMDKETTVVLSADSEFFRYLKGPGARR